MEADWVKQITKPAQFKERRNAHRRRGTVLNFLEHFGRRKEQKGEN
jgi:hypothetical protein